MTHLKKVIAAELSTLMAGELEELSGDIASAISLTLIKYKEGYAEGVLHKLFKELWTMVTEEQRRRMQELKNEEERFNI